MRDRAAILGAGVIGAGWAARFALMGWDVRVFDPSPNAQAVIDATLARARAALPALYDVQLPPEGAVTLCESVAEAVTGASWVQESLPERLALKQALYAELAVAVPDAVIASSTSGFTPSELNAGLEGAVHVIVAHPFNPAYLLPLVELVACEGAPEGMLARAEAVLRAVGMAPLSIGAEIPAHVADRLLEAVWREALWLVRDDIATTEQIDDTIRMGFGLRWAQMGLFETYRIAGGAGGMAHFLGQFGPALAWPWSRLTDVPELDAALIAKIAAQSDAQAGGQDIAALEDLRDGNLVAMMRALKDRGAAAGAVIGTHEASLLPQAPDPDRAAHLRAMTRQVPQTWVDYNGHMNEAHYLTAFSGACDQMLLWAGMDAACVAEGHSIFTVETHIRHLDEVQIGDRITVDIRVLQGGGKKLHVWQELRVGERLCATGEQLLLHVDLATRRSALPRSDVAEWLARAARAHGALPPPEGLGRGVGDPF